MPNNYLSVLYKHIIQVENKNVWVKSWGHKHTIPPPPPNKKSGRQNPPYPPPPSSPCFLRQCIYIFLYPCCLLLFIYLFNKPPVPMLHQCAPSHPHTLPMSVLGAYFISGITELHHAPCADINAEDLSSRCMNGSDVCY